MKSNKLTKENMMNELNEYGYNEENLFEILNWFYELEEEVNTIEEAYNILKGNKVNYKEYASMVDTNRYSGCCHSFHANFI